MSPGRITHTPRCAAAAAVDSLNVINSLRVLSARMGIGGCCGGGVSNECLLVCCNNHKTSARPSHTHTTHSQLKIFVQN